MAHLHARVCFHRQLPFTPEMIDSVLAEIPAEQSINDIPVWDVDAVKTELYKRSGIKASYFDAAEVEAIYDDESEVIAADELAEIEALEAEYEEKTLAARARLEALRAENHDAE